MHNLSIILSALQAAIAVVAARDRTMTVLLVAMWGRIARMGSRLERLVAQWRAGTLPPQPAARTRVAGTTARLPNYPTAPKWLLRTLGADAVAAGLQLQHLLTEAECVEFLAAVPQAGRILRPLLRMLGVAPLPAAVLAPGPARTAIAPVGGGATRTVWTIIGPAIAVSEILDA